MCGLNSSNEAVLMEAIAHPRASEADTIDAVDCR